MLIRELKKYIQGEVIVINSYQADIKPCVDCRYCWKNDKCAINDEMQRVYSLIDEADNIIIASPVYFAELTGSLLSLMSRLQYLWVARKFRNTEVLSRKKRDGAIILVDGGDGYIDTAMAMGKRLLRIMGTGFVGSVHFSGTDNIPANNIILPKHIINEIIELSLTLTASHGKETDGERRARIYPIILSEYNPEWSEWFAEERAALERLIGAESIARISHIGSTSVPGLTAKPIVDILLEINETADIDKLIAAMMSPDYICLNGTALTLPTPPPHLMFLKGYLPSGFAEKVFHIHVVYPGDRDELRFRDYLKLHPETAAEYAELKRRLLENYEHDRDGYTKAKAKTEFIRAVLEKARKP